MGKYITDEDIHLGDEFKIYLGGTTQINIKIEEVESRVEGKLVPHYRVPYSKSLITGYLKNICETLTIYELYMSKRGNAPPGVLDKYDKAMEDIAMIKSQADELGEEEHIGDATTPSKTAQTFRG